MENTFIDWTRDIFKAGNNNTDEPRRILIWMKKTPIKTKTARLLRLIGVRLRLIKEGDKLYYWYLPTDELIDVIFNLNKPHDVIKRGNKYSVKHKDYDILRKSFFETKEQAQKIVDGEFHSGSYLNSIVMEWIDVNERLPEDCENVIGCFKDLKGANKKPTICETYYNGSDWIIVEMESTFYDLEATHWMPLPEPPKEFDLIINASDEDIINTHIREVNESRND